MKLLSTIYETMKPPINMITYLIRAALAAGLFLLIPFIAMQFGRDVNWSVSDFIIAWILLFGTAIAYKLVAVNASSLAYKLGAGVASGTALFLVWSNLAVGLIGSENNPANLMYGGVLSILLLGTILARFNAHGMSTVLYATASAQALVGGIALIGAMEKPSIIIGVTGLFVTLWMASGLLFRNAALYPAKSKTSTP